MADLNALRLKYPDLKDLDDAAFANAIHQRFYSNVDKSKVFAKLGLPAPANDEKKAQAPAQPVAPPAASPVLPMIDFNSTQGLPPVSAPPMPEPEIAVAPPMPAQPMPAQPAATPLLGAVSSIINMIAPTSPAAQILAQANPPAPPVAAPGGSILDALEMSVPPALPQAPAQSPALPQTPIVAPQPTTPPI